MRPRTRDARPGSPSVGDPRTSGHINPAGGRGGAARLLAWRSLSDRPLRSALLLLGYGVGVAVMIALLSVGDALLAQARDRDLAAGGDLVLLPEGVDPAVLKVNGLTGLYLTIPQAGFVVRDLLGGPRFGADVAAAAPQIHDRIVYLRVRSRIVPANASAGVPSLDQAAHATQAVPGIGDSAADRAWIAPGPLLFDRIDHFHGPAAGRAAWAEWDYFNFIDPPSGTYGYLTLLVGGEGQGAVLVRLRRPGVPTDDLAIPVRLAPGDLSTQTAAQRIGPARVRMETGRYHVTVHDPRVQADLWLAPVPGVYLPPTQMAAGGVVSGYVVPAVEGRMSGEIRTARTAVHLMDAPAYHDHNWGTWRGVTWEWGEASGTGGALLYGELHVAGEEAPGTGGRAPALFLWAPRGAGQGRFLGVFPIRSLAYSRWHAGPVVRGRAVRAPGTITITAGDGKATATVRISVEDTLGSVLGLSPRAPAAAPAQTASLRRRASPAPSSAPVRVFLQMRGTAEVSGRVDGRPFKWRGPAAAETFVPILSPLSPRAPTGRRNR